MSRTVFDVQCKGCRPAMLDVATGRPLPDDHRLMMIVNRLWDEQSIETKMAWHRVTCLNSRASKDLELTTTFIKLFTKACE